MTNPRVRQLVSVARTINPAVGMAADLLLSIFSSPAPSRSKKVKKMLLWLENRSVDLLEDITVEAAKPTPSKARMRGLEVRLHETLSIIIDINKERPWK